jgi:hypothetical protein
VPASWVTADEADGGDPALRRFLEDRGISYALAVKGTEPLATATPGSATAAQLAAAVPGEQWVACSAGHGAKGRRLDDWAGIQLAAPASAELARWRLCAAAAATASWPATPAGPGRHLPGWAGPGGREPLEDRGGLPAGQDRGRPGPPPGAPLARLVPARHPGVVGHAVLVVTRTTATGDHPKGGRGGLTSQLGLLPLTVPEVRRLLVALAWTAPIRPGFVLAWSRWRRCHQASARRAHDQRREPQARLE